MAKSAKPPDSDRFAILEASAQQSTAKRDEFLKRIVNSFKSPIELETADLPRYVAVLREACTKNREWPDLLDHAAAIVDKCFGTHTSKFPNTNATLAESAIMKSPTPASSIGAVSSNTNLTRQYVTIGNAGDIQAWRLLSSVVRLDGVVVSVADDLASHGPIFRAIRIASPHAEVSLNQCAAKIKRRLETPSKLTSAFTHSSGYGSVPTIFWPIDDRASTFHLLSPVAALPMITELRTRQMGTNLALADLLVGGAQAQNAGLLAMETYGFISHLLSIPPTTKHRKPANLAPAIRALERLIDEDGNIVRNNINVKDAQRSIVDRMVYTIVTEMVDPPYGEPIIVTVSKIIDLFDRTIEQKFVLEPDYLEVFREVYEELVLDSASRQVAELEGIM